MHATATTTETLWVAHLDDVAPDGASRPLTQGALLGSHRALDPDRTWYLPDGTVLRPHHFSTRSAVKPVVPGEADPLRHRGLPDRRVDRAGSPAASDADHLRLPASRPDQARASRPGRRQLPNSSGWPHRIAHSHPNGRSRHLHRTFRTFADPGNLIPAAAQEARYAPSSGLGTEAIGWAAVVELAQPVATVTKCGAIGSPDSDAVLGLEKQRVSRLDVERGIPLVHVADDPVDPELGGAVDVRQQSVALSLRPADLLPARREGDEEALVAA